MITIYANWTGGALAAGATIEDAIAKLHHWHCQPGTTFGDGPEELTALDTGDVDVFHNQIHDDRVDFLYVARKLFPVVRHVGRVPSRNLYQQFVLLVIEAHEASRALDMHDLRSGDPASLAKWQHLLDVQQRAFFALIDHTEAHADDLRAAVATEST